MEIITVPLLVTTLIVKEEKVKPMSTLQNTSRKRWSVCVLKMLSETMTTSWRLPLTTNEGEDGVER